MIRCADCLAAMRELDEASVDAVVCDPPYGIGFMGKEWDGKAIAEAAQRDRERRKSLGPESASRPGRAEPRSSSAYGNEAIIAGPVRGGAEFQAWCEAWATEALRVLKPGGHLLAFGGTRTYHRLACAIEDAGFEIRDCLVWMYGSGFPKSLDVSKAIDKAAGAEREVVGPNPYNGLRGETTEGTWRKGEETGFGGSSDLTAPATPEAQRWQGWGTALKPAHEPIVLARKPLVGTVAQNVLQHGTGGLNVDGCRVGSDGGTRATVTPGGAPGLALEGSASGVFNGNKQPEPLGAGRWPANVTLDPEAAAMLDEQSGERPSGVAVQRNGGGGQIFGAERGAAMRNDDWGYGDTGGASRFFYCAKASRAERNAGLEGFEAEAVKLPGKATGFNPQTGEITEGYTGERRNVHPTVKPISLMRWLCRLVTPPGGLILDPFTGSGTTGAAAVLEGFRFLGVEREEEYAAIARARIEWWAEHRGREAEEVLADSRASDAEREKHEAAGQLGFEIE